MAQRGHITHLRFHSMCLDVQQRDVGLCSESAHVRTGLSDTPAGLVRSGGILHTASLHTASLPGWWCYGLNCAPSNLHLETRPLKRWLIKVRSLGWVLIQSDRVLLGRGNLDIDTYRGKTTWRRGEPSIRHQGRLRRNQPNQSLGLGFTASGMCENKISLFKRHRLLLFMQT